MTISSSHGLYGTPVTASEFERIVGSPPENDDLERANCPKAGTPGHRDCGVCLGCNRPRFTCVCGAMPSPHFYQQVQRAGAQKVKGVEREQGIRLYCEQAGITWALQVRGPEWIGAGYTEGKAFMVATAKLNADDLRSLRAAIDDQLEQLGEGHRS